MNGSMDRVRTCTYFEFVNIVVGAESNFIECDY